MKIGLFLVIAVLVVAWSETIYRKRKRRLEAQAAMLMGGGRATTWYPSY